MLVFVLTEHCGGEGVHLTLMFKASAGSGGPGKAAGTGPLLRCRGLHTWHLMHSRPSLPRSHPTPLKPHPSPQALAQIQRTRCPAHKHLGSYSVRGPKLGHNEDRMSQKVSLEHPILRGWQIRKQTSQSTVMGRRPELWDLQPAWEWDWAQEEPREDTRQAGGSKQGQCRPYLGNFYKVGSQPVDSRGGGGQVEGGRCGKTGRDSIIQKVLSCQAFRD